MKENRGKKNGAAREVELLLDFEVADAVAARSAKKGEEIGDYIRRVLEEHIREKRMEER